MVRFLSTPSARRATLVGGRDGHGREISIHALCEEGDSAASFSNSSSSLFLSTPSARRATSCLPILRFRLPISIHALCEEGDNQFSIFKRQIFHFYPRPLRGGRRFQFCNGSHATDFYPRPLRGGRPKAGLPDMHIVVFLSTPSARRATSSTGQDIAFCIYFYPRPLRGGRPKGIKTSKGAT